ncbi:MAG: phosphoenolpyruvate--protein phosphotransferase [Verrucomicrobia bacterium]|nr:phosphoenolpyruvate--protein phosphotransferase [Verrucomicrobiota bacterium]
MKGESREIRLRGAPICAGIAIGDPFVYTCPEEVIPELLIPLEEIEREVLRYRQAIEKSRSEINYLRGKLENEGAIEAAAILDAHLEILRDPMLTEAIERKIRSTQKNSEYVFQTCLNDYAVRFQEVTDPYFRERLNDLNDIARRILGKLRSTVRFSLLEAPHQSIVFARELVPSDTAEADAGRIGALVTQMGGDTSHTAIVAKAKGIPYVARVDFRGVGNFTGAPVIVDGRIGEVILNPSERTLSKYRVLQQEHEQHLRRFAEQGHLRPETVDGYQVHLTANIEMYQEVELIQRYGGSGIGLLRSEYLCLSGGVMPSEEEQYRIYRRIVESMRGKPVVIRTFDVGGDKFRELPIVGEEENPFLGCRAIRLMLKEHEAFKTQLKAILRASFHGDVRLLFPMVSGLPELLEAKSYLAEAEAELVERKEKFRKNIPIGIMIEVPSAAITCDILARECDFMSIGTNDLVQYCLAVDRDNKAMSYLYTPAHPAVLRLIKMIVSEGNRNGIPVSLCGEVAADPRFTALLLGLGVHELSVIARYLPIVKSAIRNTNIVQATHLAERVLGMSTAMDVLDALIAHHQETVQGQMIPNSGLLP